MYLAFCQFGQGSAKSSAVLEGRSWKKLVTDCGLLGKGYTQVDIDLTFARVKDKGAKSITFAEFLNAIAEIATKQKCTADDIAAKIVAAGGPKSSGTVAAATKLHDDKGTWTGTHVKGGPSTNDNRISLSNLADRSAADARGVQYTQK